MNFRSVAQLSDQVLKWSRDLPGDIDLIVGVPRSGLLVAMLLGTYRNLPVTDVDGLLAGRCFAAGSTKGAVFGDCASLPESRKHFLERPRKVLVVDDSLHSGRSLAAVRERIASAELIHEVSYGVVYVRPDQTDVVDYFCEALHPPRMFEWNLFHHPSILRKSCVDLRVLCKDPFHEYNGDERCLDVMRGVPPLQRPGVEIGWIVTSRLDRYRPQTEAWLRRHGVVYQQLVMRDNAYAAPHSLRAHAPFKAGVYRDTGARLFVESDVREAFDIAALARKEVLCVDTMQLIVPGTSPIPRPALPLRDRSIPPVQSWTRRMARAVVPGPLRSTLKSIAPALTQANVRT